jgi:hypothetical protein
MVSAGDSEGVTVVGVCLWGAWSARVTTAEDEALNGGRGLTCLSFPELEWTPTGHLSATRET